LAKSLPIFTIFLQLEEGVNFSEYMLENFHRNFQSFENQLRFGKVIAKI